MDFSKLGFPNSTFKTRVLKSQTFFSYRLPLNQGLKYTSTYVDGIVFFMLIFKIMAVLRIMNAKFVTIKILTNSIYPLKYPNTHLCQQHLQTTSTHGAPALTFLDCLQP